MGILTTDDPEFVEQVWKIESVAPLDEDTLLVSFRTAYYDEDDEITSETNPRKHSNRGLQTVQVSRDIVPSVAEHNSGRRQSLKAYLQDTLEFDA